MRQVEPIFHVAVGTVPEEVVACSYTAPLLKTIRSVVDVIAVLEEFFKVPLTESCGEVPEKFNVLRLSKMPPPFMIEAPENVIAPLLIKVPLTVSLLPVTAA